MLQIRRNTFETNSSSCHSISISNSSLNEYEEFDIPKNKEGKIELRTGEFSYGDEIDTLSEKLTYLMTLAIRNCNNEEEIKNCEDLKWLEEQLKDVCNGIFIPKKFKDNGHIDSEIRMSPERFLINEFMEDDIMEFLTNSRYGINIYRT